MQLDKLLPPIKSYGFGQYVGPPEEEAPNILRRVDTNGSPPAVDRNGNKKTTGAINRPEKGYSGADPFRRKCLHD